MLPKSNTTQIQAFRLSLLKNMGSTRGNAESGFIRSVNDAIHRFYTTVAVHLDPTTPHRTLSKPVSTTTT